jgi:predicted nucleotidyltransferase
MRASTTEVEQKLTPMEIKVLREFLSSVTVLPVIEKVFLYGSRSEMESTEWSDIDIAIVVVDKGHIREVEKKVESWLINSSPDLLIHPVVIDKETLKSRGIGERIKEGILLWQKE